MTRVHSSQEEALTLAEWEESNVTSLPAIDWWGIQRCSCCQSVRHSAVAVTRLALVSKNIDYLLYFFLLPNKLWGLFILVLLFLVH